MAGQKVGYLGHGRGVRDYLTADGITAARGWEGAQPTEALKAKYLIRGDDRCSGGGR